VLLLAFPIILRDVNAESALLSSLGMVAIVSVTYYLRMVKREIDFNRLRVAVGGVCFGAGLLIILLSFAVMPPSVQLIAVVVGLVSIVGGIFNIFASSRKID
ncbi:MAG: hypothetical protein NWF03_01410, partial [Candidatus Bathyarchaeota archaeon]|nr:hypothetical protein [Candidatus Bathyarchaeota archaeon]